MNWLDYLLPPSGYADGGLFLFIFITIRLMLLVSYVWFVAAGAQINWKWGVGNFLFPPVALAFYYLYPKKARWPGMLFFIGLIAYMAAIVIFQPFSS
jgi:hypothetical protein